MKYIASASGGKDSTAMIEILLEKGLPLDEIVFIAVEKEFPQEKQHREFLIERWSPNVKCTVIQSQTTWDNWFNGKLTRGKNKGKKRGFPLTAFPCYWTREAKVKVIEQYIKNQQSKEEIIQYIGYTINEKSSKRKKIINSYKNGQTYNGRLFPLIEWGMTEEDCKKFCESRGILNPLYKYFNRLGCYLCPKQNEETLKKLCINFPKQWDELIRYCKKSNSNEYIKPSQFNLKFNLKELLELERWVEKHNYKEWE